MRLPIHRGYRGLCEDDEEPTRFLVAGNAFLWHKRAALTVAAPTRGIPRCDQVQAENKKTDKDTDPTKGSKVKKTRTRELGEKDQAQG